MNSLKRLANVIANGHHLPALQASSALYQKLDARGLSTENTDIRKCFEQKIPEAQDKIKQLKALGKVKLDDVHVEQVVGGMRGILAMIWETSLLDANEGIRFRGYTIPEIQKKLPYDGEPQPEGLLWLLLTGEVPTKAQASALTAELESRAQLPSHTFRLLEQIPKETHPMTQFSQGVLSLQVNSKFAAAYSEGLHKSKYWQPYLEDSLDLIAKLPALAALIYRRNYKDGSVIPWKSGLDWAANLSHMMGYQSEGAYELMRLYQTIHTDHEGGNVSAHATHLVGSALSDPYLCFTAGMTGLAGPLHGLANQEVMRFLKEVEKKIGLQATEADVEKMVRDLLASGRVVPGFGHGVLRVTDPRYTCQRAFAEKHLPDDPWFRLVKMLYEVVPKVLIEGGKVKNPWPNVDAHSGILLTYYGISEENFYTVLFGVARSIGTLSQGTWSRALGLALERPKSITLDALIQQAKQSA